MVGTGRSEAKPPILPSSKLGVSSESEEENSENEGDAECLYCTGFVPC